MLSTAATGAPSGAIAVQAHAVTLAPMIDWEASIPSAQERHPNHFEPAPRAAAVECWSIPREEWPPGWFPTQGYARFHELKAQEAEDRQRAAEEHRLSLEEFSTNVPDVFDQTLVATLQRPSEDESHILALVAADRRKQEAQQEACRARRQKLALAEEARERRVPALKAKALAAKEERRRVVQAQQAREAAAAMPPPPKPACLVPRVADVTPSSKALGKRKVDVVPAAAKEKEADAAPEKKQRSRARKVRPLIVPQPKPLIPSSWRLSGDAVCTRLGIRDEKDLRDRLQSLDPTADKLLLGDCVRGFKNILACSGGLDDFGNLTTLLAWRQSQAEVAVDVLARQLFKLMYMDAGDPGRPENAHIFKAVTAWTEALGDGKGGGYLAKLCALQA